MSDVYRFFLGKNKVMQVALGKSPETEPADNTHLLSKVCIDDLKLILVLERASLFAIHR